MFMWKNFKPAQSIMEYCLFVGIIALALATMQTYARRGVQAVIKVTADQMGNHTSAQSFEETKTWVKDYGRPLNTQGVTRVNSVKEQKFDDGAYTTREISTQTSETKGKDLRAIVTDNTR